jgi:shikimate dehydrogenase
MDQYGVIGNPVQHSKSPLIYRLFAEQTGQSLQYSAILVELEGLAVALAAFQAQGGKGVNITLPFKHRAVALVDSLTERAQRAEAINTITFNEDGSRLGDNTDGVGLVRDILVNKHFSIRGKRILVLGAGGAVRGIIDPLFGEHPSEIVIANRTENKAVALAEEFSDAGSTQACPLSLLENNSFDLVINGTSASLQDEMLDLPGSILKEDALCYDMVYGRGVTPFLRWAREQGSVLCVDGLGMLVEQAAESFYLWRNSKPDTKPVFAALNDSMLSIAELSSAN